jgi:hypothetical protein
MKYKLVYKKPFETENSRENYNLPSQSFTQIAMDPNKVSKICNVAIPLVDSVFPDGKCRTCDLWSNFMKMPSFFHPLNFRKKQNQLTHSVTHFSFFVCILGEKREKRREEESALREEKSLIGRDI